MTTKNELFSSVKIIIMILIVLGIIAAVSLAAYAITILLRPAPITARQTGPAVVTIFVSAILAAGSGS